MARMYSAPVSEWFTYFPLKLSIPERFMRLLRFNTDIVVSFFSGSSLLLFKFLDLMVFTW